MSLKAKGKSADTFSARSALLFLPFAFCLLPSAFRVSGLPFAFTVAPSQTSQQPGQTPSPTPTAATADGEAVERIEADATNVLLTATDKKRRCGTAVWDAVTVSVEEVLSKTPKRTRRAIILLSDGDDYDSHVRLYQAAEDAVRNDTVVYSVGIRDKHFELGSLRRDFLSAISEQTGGRAFFPKTPAALAAAFSEIEQELRSQYLISYTPTNRSKGGNFRKLQIEIANPELRKQDLRLLYRQGYYARMKDEGGRMKD